MRFFVSVLVGAVLILGSLVGCKDKKAADDGTGPRLVPPGMTPGKKSDRPQPNMPPAPPPPPSTPPPK